MYIIAYHYGEQQWNTWDGFVKLRKDKVHNWWENIEWYGLMKLL